MTKHEIDEAKIRDAAYLIWIDEGQPEGRDEEHWMRAVEVLKDAKPNLKKVRTTPAKPSTAKGSSSSKSTVARSGKTKTPAAAKKSTKTTKS